MKWRTLDDLPPEMHPAYSAGDAARWDCYEAMSCPFAAHTGERVAWYIGFWDADAEISHLEKVGN